MNFLDSVFLDNTIGAWLMVVGIILLALILKKLVSRYIAGLLFRLVHKIWKTVDKRNFVDLALEPLQWFVLILIAVFSMDKLNFPSLLQYNIYGFSTQSIFERIGTSLIIIAFTGLLLRLIDFVALVLEEKASTTLDKTDDQLIVFFRDFLKVILSIIGILLLIKFVFGQNIGTVLTGLSIVGAALALAARESLENIIASFIIFFDKPFVTGDNLKIQQVTGTVERIGLRSTRIRTADKTLVSVPNKQMVDSIVDNISMRTERRAEIKIELSPKTSVAEIKKTITDIKALFLNYPAVILTYSVLLKEINKAGLLITTEFLTNPIPLDEFEQLREAMNLQIIEVLEKNNIDMAGISSVVTIQNESKESSPGTERPLF